MSNALIRFLFLDYWDTQQGARVITILMKAPGVDWSMLEEGTALLPASGVLAHPVPADVPGKMESRRLSLAESEALTADADSYWERATPRGTFTL